MATGPGEIQDSKWELEADVELFIQAAEVSLKQRKYITRKTFISFKEIIFPYSWTTFNVLVLPPSFPYGGMENPVFTFATPTLISGVSFPNNDLFNANVTSLQILICN